MYATFILPYPYHLQPEVAHVGLYQDDLTAKGIKFDTYTRQLKDVDRAVLDGETDGMQCRNILYSTAHMQGLPHAKTGHD